GRRDRDDGRRVDPPPEDDEARRRGRARRRDLPQQRPVLLRTHPRGTPADRPRLLDRAAQRAAGGRRGADRTRPGGGSPRGAPTAARRLDRGTLRPTHSGPTEGALTMANIVLDGVTKVFGDEV